MKKLTAISILTLFILSQWGYYFLYTYQQCKAKMEARARLLQNMPESFLTVIDAGKTPGTIKWEEAHTEFSLNGRMYDVVRIKKEQGKTIIVCISDDKEDAVIKAYANSVKKDADPNTTPGKTKTGIKINLQDWTVENGNDLLENAYTESKKVYAHFSERSVSRFKEIVSPPPNINI